MDRNDDRPRPVDAVERRAADASTTEVVTNWFGAGMPADEWAARNAHLFGSFSLDQYSYANPALDEWVSELGRVLNSHEALANARHRYPTPEERAEIAQEELEPL